MRFFIFILAFSFFTISATNEQDSDLKNMPLVNETIMFKRLLDLKDWSIDKARSHFPNQMGGGEKGDAYRHVLASVLSRKLFGRAIASSSGFVNELIRDVRKTNTPRDRFMDLHNNRVGRVTCYHELIGKTDEETANNVLEFFNESGNLVLMKWGGVLPDSKRAKKESRQKAYANQVILY
ncbi:MAG: hypothetical protein JXQ87_16695 [Bacteroidia bacterium]